MAGFTPFKRHANKFNYTPRYYDPLREELEKRRLELRGERRDSPTSDEAYTPGQYIRNKRMAREQRRHETMQGGRRRVWVSIAIVVMVFLVGSMIYPKILEAFDLSSRDTSVQEYEEFNPYAPITVVPNNYTE